MVGSSKAVSVFMLVLMMHDVTYCSSAQLPIANGVRFIGIGYNILKGNPEGEASKGGVDPGLLTTRHVIDLTYDDGKVSSDNRYRVPDEVYYTPRSSSHETTWKTTFHGTSSYAKKLDHQVEVSGSVNIKLASARFGASTGYKRVKDRTKSENSVFLARTTVKNHGSLRYLTERAKRDQFRLDRGFVYAACRLPNTWSESKYMTFIDNWGTHVVTYVDVGILRGVNRKEEMSSFVTYASKNDAASVRAGGRYHGYSASLKVDMESFNSDEVEETKFGSMDTSYTIGSEDLNEPIKYTLKSMHELFYDMFWGRWTEYIREGYCSNSWKRSSVVGLVLKALGKYPAWKGVSASTDADVIIPLSWPIGVYGLPKPTSGCPGELQWNEGSRFYDTEDNGPDNTWSYPLHLAGERDKSGMDMQFCMKTVEGPDSAWTWQPGSYCIYKYGTSCPDNFDAGWIRWDDEDGSNGNRRNGILPAGIYDSGSKTSINFCCRNDGQTNDKIYLPTEMCFMLLSHLDHCQQVHDMDVRREWFRWDTEDSGNGDAQSNIHPYEGVLRSGSFIILYFCYYS